MTTTAARTAAPYGPNEIVEAAIAQARAEFARSGDLRALALAQRIECRHRANFPGPALTSLDDDEWCIPGGRSQ